MISVGRELTGHFPKELGCFFSQKVERRMK